jgi:hypothetical protein
MRIGLPTGFQQTFVGAGMVVLYWIVTQFGFDANTAYSAAGNIDSFAFMPVMSFAVVLSIFALPSNPWASMLKHTVCTLHNAMIKTQRTLPWFYSIPIGIGRCQLIHYFCLRSWFSNILDF